jgi:nickel transport protein
MLTRLVVVALLALAAGTATAHQVLHQVQRGKAIAVRVYESDGDPVAETSYEVYSPASPAAPWQTGRTDRSGWLAFVPEVPGRWRVRVIDPTGHGLDVVVEVAPPAAPPAGAASTDPTTSGPDGGREAVGSSAAFVLRPLLGLAVVGVVFAALLLAWRKKGAPPGR